MKTRMQMRGMWLAVVMLALAVMNAGAQLRPLNSGNGSGGSSGSVTGSYSFTSPLVLSGTNVSLPLEIANLKTNVAFTNAAMIFSNVVTLNPTSTTARLNGMHLTNQAQRASFGQTIDVQPGDYLIPTNAFSILRNGINWNFRPGARVLSGTAGDSSDFGHLFHDWSGVVTSYVWGAGTFIVSNDLANVIQLTNSLSRVIIHAKEIRAANEQAAVLQDGANAGGKLWIYASEGIYANGYDAVINQCNPNAAQTYIYASQIVGHTDAGDSAVEVAAAYANPGDCVIRSDYARGDLTLSDNMDVAFGTLNLGANNVIYTPLSQQGNGVLRNTYVYGSSNRTASLIQTPSDSGLFGTIATFVQNVFVGPTNRATALITNNNGRATTFIACQFWDGFGGTNSIRAKNAQKVVLINTDTPLGLHANISSSTYTNHVANRFKVVATFEQGIDVSSDLNANGQLNAGDFTTTGTTIIGGPLEIPTGASSGYVLTSDGSGVAGWAAPSGGSGTTNYNLLNADRFIVTNHMDFVEWAMGVNTNGVIPWGATNTIVYTPSNTFTITMSGTPPTGLAREVDLLLINTNSTAGYFPTNDLNGGTVYMLPAPSTNRYKFNWRGGRFWISSGQQPETGTNAYMRTRTGVRRTIWVDASFFNTNGAGSSATTPGVMTSASNGADYNYQLFSGSAAQTCNAGFPMPPEWDRGNITVVPHWTATNSSGNVVWQLAVDYADNDGTIDGAFGSYTTSTDTLLSTSDYHIAPASGAITFGNAPAAASGRIKIKVYRDPAHASNTLDVNAFLFGVQLQYTESTTEPTALP